MMSPALTAAVILFGSCGALSLAVGLFVPFVIRSGDASGPGPPGLFHPRPDAAVFGPEPVGERDSARVRLLGVMHWDWLSGTLVSFGILQIAVDWFGLASGERWAYFALVLANLALAPYYALIVRRYARAGARLRLLEIPPLMWVPAFLVPIAIVLGWIGLPS